MHTSSKLTTDFFKNKTGLLLCICSLTYYFLLNLPLNLSVLCANQNQGFAFTWGQNFLLWGELTCGRGPLFILLYAIILKIFGFNTWSIIGVHIVETIIFILVGVLIYLIVNKALKSSFYSGLAVLLWVTFITSPLSTPESLKVEILSHFNLSEESLCILFSLGSLYFLLRERKKSSFLAGIFAVCSFMSKANGAILGIATILWFIQLALFKKEDFKLLGRKFLFYFIGVISSLALFNLIIYILKGDLVSFWKDYFLIGSYTNEHLKSAQSILGRFLIVMTRNSNSASNFILFLFALLLFIWGLVKCFVSKPSPEARFWSLIGIWGIGNVLVIIIPGEYQPYYYHLIWTQIAIIFVLALQGLFLKIRDKKKIITSAAIFISIFFVYRVFLSIPAHYNIAKYYFSLNIFNQSQSFQDPVLSYDSSLIKRAGYLQLADKINILLPSKTSTLYIFNFNEGGYTGLTPLSYIYAKRYPPTTVDCHLLQIPNILESKLIDLRSDLIKRPPDLLIISKTNYLQPWQIKPLSPFLEWFSNFTNTNYKIETALEYKQLFGEQRVESFVVYRKINS